MYNLIECTDNCSKPSGSLWQYFTDDSNDTMVNAKSFLLKIGTTGKTLVDNNTKDVEIVVLLKYLSSF